MKKIISGNELRNKMLEGINLLCNTVKETLGPKGSNIIIDHSMLSPFITNDGVTIAENIESEDEIINTILTLTKEASIKTNELVGDGTTTTLVLLQSIYNEGIKRINEGVNPILLKKEINSNLEDIIKLIEKESKIPTKKNLKDIAKVSGGSDIIANIISDAYNNVNSKESINLIETEKNHTYIEILDGYIFETLIASPYFFKNNINIEFNNPQILLINNALIEINSIENIINECINKDIPLIIIANDYSEIFINEILSIYFDNKLKVILLKNPEYGINKNKLYEELGKISNANIITKMNNICLNDLGNISKIKINNENTIINFIEKNNIKLKNFESTINIYVGATTTLERRELKMRFEDAICATFEAKKGILPGSGITLYKISEKLPNTNIIKNALKIPLEQILLNSGLEPNKIIQELQNCKFEKLYNVLLDKYENINETHIIDPASVIINSLKNASSIAAMLLTTTSLIINEYKQNINPSNMLDM